MKQGVAHEDRIDASTQHIRCDFFSIRFRLGEEGDAAEGAGNEGIPIGEAVLRFPEERVGEGPEGGVEG